MSSEWYESRLLENQDAYTDWAITQEFLSLPGDDRDSIWFPIIARLNGSAADIVKKIESENEKIKKARTLANDIIIIPPIYDPGAEPSAAYDSDEDQSDSDQYITALLSLRFFDLLNEDELRELKEYVPQITIGQPIRMTPRQESKQRAQRPTPPRQEPGQRSQRQSGDSDSDIVVIGVIDDGIAFAHERFCTINDQYQRRTRVKFAWLQGDDDDFNDAYGTPSVFGGREYSKQDIDELLDICSQSGALDEDKFYRLIGIENFSRIRHKPTAWRVAHGTHVMDLAAGDPLMKVPDGNPDPYKRPIVCVQLPPLLTEDTSGLHLEPHLNRAVEFILAKADQIASDHGCSRLPVVINFSYGLLAGPHDGTHPIERVIDRFLRRRNLRVTLPAGNSHLARCHAQLYFQAPGDVVELDWRVLPDDRTPSFLEIWLPYTDERPRRSRAELWVTPPGGTQSHPPLGEHNGSAREWRSNGEVLCKISYEFVEESGRGRFVVAMRPTASHGMPAKLAPSGIWKVKLRNLSLTESERVELWIQRDDTPPRYPLRGRQSYFDDHRYTRFDPISGEEIEDDDGASPVKRAGSMNSIATGRRPVVIGGYLGRERVPAKYSAGGPITKQGGDNAPHRDGPDALAVSDDSRAHRGVLAAGGRSGSVVAMNGTSVAAPQVTRTIANELANARPGDRDAIQQRADADESNLPPTVPQRPNLNRGGHGRLVLPRHARTPRYWR